MTEAPHVEMRTLGKTDIRVTPIGLGMMEFGADGMMRFVDRPDATGEQPSTTSHGNTPSLRTPTAR